MNFSLYGYQRGFLLIQEIRITLETVATHCHGVMFCPPFPDEALVFAFCKYLQSFREGKLISLAEIMKPYDKYDIKIIR
jgi:hypothetical protein